MLIEGKTLIIFVSCLEIAGNEVYGAMLHKINFFWKK